jgi:lipid II:glycine glycyltransferase (peptidoglycan interpeptide bridge formation enzyme)
VTPILVAREAAPDELATWDARTVDPPGGDVQQSRAWALHRSHTGWRPYHLVLEDGSAALVLGRPKPLLSGRAYVPRGPVSAGADPIVVAGRIAGLAAWARAAGYDTLLVDPEIPTAGGFLDMLEAIGFHSVEEVGPSRHRVAVPIAPGADDDALLAGIAPKTRQQILAAERRGIRIAAYGVQAATARDLDIEMPGGEQGSAVEEAFGRMYTLLATTGERRGFSVASPSAALAWWRSAVESGHLILLESIAPDGAVIGGSLVYRHGGRLTYGHSGDDPELRAAHPGAMGLLLWRALQLAVREGCTELDLGGVDVVRARRPPLPGEPTYGLLRFKQSLGGQWIEQAGAHQKTLRRIRRVVRGVVSPAVGAARALRGAARGRGQPEPTP